MWYEDSVFYQIYPLGAAGAPFENDHILEHRIQRFEDWVEPLHKMGIDAIIFNPLFSSETHGYDTTDYKVLDERLGNNEDLKALCDTIHKSGMKVMFDGVFNHVGRSFAPFQDVLKNRENSKYKDWFQIDFNGNNGYNDGLWYQGWEGNDNLVQLNLQNPEVADYLLGIVDFWIDEFGVDGLRLDVAYCMNRDFLRKLEAHVKERNPEFFMYGEIIHGDYNTLVSEDLLPSCTNYEAQKGIYSSFNSTNFYEILYSFNREFGKEQWCLYTGKPLMCFLDNHDVNRIASLLNKKEHLPLVYAMLMTMPGMPIIYYGSEWGIEGVKNENDTSIRPEVKELESNALTETIEKLIDIHHTQPALHNGDYAQIAINNGWCTYSRSKDDNTVWTSFNITDQPVDIPVPYQGSALNLYTDEIEDIPGSVHLEPNSFKIHKLS